MTTRAASAHPLTTLPNDLRFMVLDHLSQPVFSHGVPGFGTTGRMSLSRAFPAAFSAQVIKHESVYPDTAILSIAGLTIPPDFAGGTDITCDEEAANGYEVTSDGAAETARNPHPHSALWVPLASGEVHTVLIPAGASDQASYDIVLSAMRHISDMGYSVDRYLPDEGLRASTGPIDSAQLGDHGQYIEDLKAILYPLAWKPDSAGKFPILEIHSSDPTVFWGTDFAIPPKMVVSSTIAADGRRFKEPLFSRIPQTRPSLQHRYYWDVKDAIIDGKWGEQKLSQAFDHLCQRRLQDMSWFDDDSKTAIGLFVRPDGHKSSPESGPESTSPAGSPGSSENSGPHVSPAEVSIPPGTESKIPTTVRTDADLAAIWPDLQFWASSHKPKRPNQVLSYEHGTEPEKEYLIRGEGEASSLANSGGEAAQ